MSKSLSELEHENTILRKNIKQLIVIVRNLIYKVSFLAGVSSHMDVEDIEKLDHELSNLNFGDVDDRTP